MSPRTEAGKRLIAWARKGQVPGDVTAETVLAIEAEAIAARDAELRAAVMLIEPCCDDMRIGNLRAMCQHGAYVRDSLLALLDQPVVPKP